MILILELVLVVLGAIAIDLAFGDPKNRYHPTAWIGRLISVMVPAFAGRGRATERLGGTAVILTVAGIPAVLLLALGYFLSDLETNNHYPYLALVASVLTCCILLKCTIAVRSMQQHADAVVLSLRQDQTVSARVNLSMIVKRKTGNLNKEQIISGVLESVGENTVDGVTGSLFYYGLFGLPGAFVHRAINTADSMVGYRNDLLGHLGWFAARCDTVLNYVPARLTGLAMVGAAALLQYDWRGSYRTMIRDGHLPSSRNSGYPMAALAGALGIRLEKEDHYTLGKNLKTPSIRDVGRAVALMKVTTLVFTAGVVLPAGLASAFVAGYLLGV